MKLLLISILVTTVAFSSASYAATYSVNQCQAWFQSVDRNKDGSLGRNEKSTMFLSRITLAEDEGGEYIMTKSFFVAECKIGSLGKPPI
jgi:hypothetical protein